MEMMLDYSAEEVLGRSSLDFVHPDHAAFLRQRTESRLLGEEDKLVRRGVADGRMLLLEKPFSPATLNCRVREALARGV
jgi:PAS domain S-box-containing protein